MSLEIAAEVTMKVAIVCKVKTFMTILRLVKAWCTAYSLISLYQPITTNYMIMNIIDLERPPIVCIEAAVCNGGQALRLIVRVRK